MLPEIPLAHWINEFVNWLYGVAGPFLNTVSQVIRLAVNGVTQGMEDLPWWLLALIIVAIAYLANRWKLALSSALGLLLIYDLKLWNHMVTTLVLVLLSALISIVAGLPLGILSARSKAVYRVLSPILDLMQTLPAFVYLVPVLMFFNIGLVPAIFATVIFAMPPVIRLTRLGILQVSESLLEVSAAFGASRRQLLWKVQIPLARPSIMAGINQTIMMSLSMVVIASMIGAQGLGADVMSALQNINVGEGFVAGLSIVIVAMILDRISGRLGQFHQTDANRLWKSRQRGVSGVSKENSPELNKA